MPGVKTKPVEFLPKTLIASPTPKLSNEPSSSRHHYIAEIFISTFLETTIHGIIPIINRKNWFIRIFWIICTLASTCVCAYLVTLGFLTYFTYETVTKTEQIYLLSTDFPAISICNVDAFMTNESTRFVEELFFQNMSLSQTELEVLFSNFTIYNLLLYKYLAGTNAYDPASRSDEFRKKLGYSLDEILFSCTYNLFPCSASDFIWYFDVFYGNCFMFNSGIFQFLIFFYKLFVIKKIILAWVYIQFCNE